MTRSNLLSGLHNMSFVEKLTSEPGTITQGFLSTGENPAGVPEGIPVIIMQGAEAGPTLWIQAAVHGDEFPASWAVSTLGREVDPKQLKGRLILLPILHFHAFLARQKTSPVDGLDISHQTPGNPKGSYTQRIAYRLNQMMLQEADAMIDVHSGTSTYFCIEFASYAAGLKASQEAEDMALATGSPVVLQRPVTPETMPSRMFMYATDNGVPGLMISIGGHRRTEPEFIRPLVEQCKNVMRHLKMIPGSAPAPDRSKLHKGLYLIPCTKGGFVFSHVSIGDWVESGQRLVEIRDVFGNTLEKIECPVIKAHVIETASGTLQPGELAIELFGAFD